MEQSEVLKKKPCGASVIERPVQAELLKRPDPDPKK